MEPKVQAVVELINTVLEDSSIPKNIRAVLANAKSRLMTSEEITLKVSAAIYMIEPISEDVNMPSYARTQVWSILSALESIKH
ncbi:MAG: UPF0147 family protein [Candidatus ainarchaeum sp.]|nr:UPF0147 family protein [Candidatus ainarchaeum sp.]